MKKLSQAMQDALEAIERNGIRNKPLPDIKKTTLDALRERGLIEYVYRPMMIDATQCEKTERDAVNEFLNDFLAKKEYITEGFISYESWEDLQAIIKYEWLVFKTNKRALQNKVEIAGNALIDVASCKSGLEAFDLLSSKLGKDNTVDDLQQNKNK